MKNIKLSFALIIAVLAVGVTFASNAKALSGKFINGCFRASTLQIQVRDLANPSSPTSSEVFTPQYNITACPTVDAQVFTNGKQYLRVATTSITQEFNCDLTSPVFCCLELQEIASPNDPLYADVPFVNLGDGLKKYQITEVKCKIQ